MQNKLVEKKTDNQKGFIRIIILIIVLVIILAALGYSPSVIWNNVVLPLFSFIWTLLTLFIEFLLKALRMAISAIKDISESIK